MLNPYKYFDCVKNRIINENDICEYSNWINPGEYSCTLHPKGFKIFLSKQEIYSNNEYADSDPYTFDLNSTFHNARVESTIHLIGSVFKKDDEFKLLDIGCGKGYITDRICRRFPRSEVSALDYSFSAIDFANDNFKNIDFIVANAYNLPYSKDYYDIIICNNIWEHVPDPLNMLKEMKRVLKKGGHLIISTPSRYRIENILRRLIGKPVKFMSNKHITEYSVGQVIEQLKHNGFKTIKIYSKKNYKIEGIKSRIIYGFIKSILKSLVVCLKLSPHMLESTCYFLAINDE